MKLKNYQEDLVLYVADIVIKDRPDIEADKAFRRAAKAKVKALDAEKSAEAMGVIIESEKAPSSSDN